MLTLPQQVHWHAPSLMQVLDSKPTDLGGIKSATAMISGHGAFGELRWESGVHRATMVPGNDKHGRMQTGTAVVIALPEAPDNVSQSAIPLWVSVIVVREGGVMIVGVTGCFHDGMGLLSSTHSQNTKQFASQ